MKLFRGLYQRAMRWSRHPRAEWYLGAVSFTESSFFPLPTAMMLAPMVLANRARAWRLAGIATVTSVGGGLLGYFIGLLVFEQIGQPIIEFYHATEKFAAMKIWFAKYGVWLVLLAGFTPIPYKVITITSGVLALPLGWFVMASFIGRASQFFLVAAVLWWGGAKLESVLEKWMEPIGWAMVALALGGYWALR